LLSDLSDNRGEILSTLKQTDLPVLRGYDHESSVPRSRVDPANLTNRYRQITDWAFENQVSIVDNYGPRDR
jgi:hypothetical protein